MEDFETLTLLTYAHMKVARSGLRLITSLSTRALALHFKSLPCSSNFSPNLIRSSSIRLDP